VQGRREAGATKGSHRTAASLACERQRTSSFRIGRADRTLFGRKPAAGLSAISSAKSYSSRAEISTTRPPSLGKRSTRRRVTSNPLSVPRLMSTRTMSGPQHVDLPQRFRLSGGRADYINSLAFQNLLGDSEEALVVVHDETTIHADDNRIGSARTRPERAKGNASLALLLQSAGSEYSGSPPAIGPRPPTMTQRAPGRLMAWVESSGKDSWRVRYRRDDDSIGALGIRAKRGNERGARTAGSRCVRGPDRMAQRVRRSCCIE
jgi:hypothetical protein